MPDHLLLAFGFGSLPMLGWLAAAAAPILIHLWSRRKYREVSWAAVQFLLAAMHKNARRIRLQQWLLLAVRTLILVLVVLALAEPYGEWLGAHVGEDVPAHRVLVIDGSFSMDYRPRDGSLFSLAKKLATRLVEASRPGDVFTLILMDDHPRVVRAPLLIDPAIVKTEIESLEQTHGGGDLTATLALVQETLKRSQEHSPPLERQEVFIFTDLGRTSWQAVGQAGKPDVRYTILDLGQSRAANLAVTDITSLGLFATVGQETTLQASVQNFSDQPQPQCSVQWLVDDMPVKEENLSLAAREKVDLRLDHRFVSSGNHTVAVRLQEDRLEIDNTRWLIVPVKEEVRVLCVAGRRGAASYVAKALAPESTDASPIRPVIISEGDLTELKLDPFDCLFLCNVAQLTSGEADRLARYVQQGGGVVFFLGDQVLADRYHAVLGVARQSVEPLLPARLGEIVTEDRYRLDPLDYRHPIVAPFRGRERAGLLTTPVYRSFRLEPLQGGSVALAFEGGDPLIVTASVGRGRSIVVATAGSLASVEKETGKPWTTMPAWPSFLPIVRELLAYAAGGKREPWQRIVGEVSKRSGIFYEQDPVTQEMRPLAVNVNSAESDLTKIDRGALPPGVEVRTDWQEGSTRAGKRGSNFLSQTAWHHGLLWGALGLMFLESLLAWQFGRETA